MVGGLTKAYQHIESFVCRSQRDDSCLQTSSIKLPEPSSAHMLQRRMTGINGKPFPQKRRQKFWTNKWSKLPECNDLSGQAGMGRENTTSPYTKEPQTERWQLRGRTIWSYPSQQRLTSPPRCGQALRRFPTSVQRHGEGRVGGTLSVGRPTTPAPGIKASMAQEGPLRMC